MTFVLLLLLAFVGIGLISERRRGFAYTILLLLTCVYMYYAYYHG